MNLCYFFKRIFESSKAFRGFKTPNYFRPLNGLPMKKKA